MKNKPQKSILVIEDDVTYAELLEILLEDSGFDVELLPNGNNLIECIKKLNPDLLVIDYNLPGKNGAELTKRVKQHTKFQNLPVVMVSANHDIRKKAMESGSNDFFAKPFSFPKFVSKIAELVG